MIHSQARILINTGRVCQVRRLSLDADVDGLAPGGHHPSRVARRALAWRQSSAQSLAKVFACLGNGCHAVGGMFTGNFLREYQRQGQILSSSRRGLGAAPMVGFPFSNQLPIIKESMKREKLNLRIMIRIEMNRTRIAKKLYHSLSLTRTGLCEMEKLSVWESHDY